MSAFLARLGVARPPASADEWQAWAASRYAWWLEREVSARRQPGLIEAARLGVKTEAAILAVRANELGYQALVQPWVDRYLQAPGPEPSPEMLERDIERLREDEQGACDRERA